MDSDAVELCRQLVRIDTRNPGQAEREAAVLLADRLRENGCEVSVLEFAPGRANVVARIVGDTPSVLCLTGHLDTVPLGMADWSVSPFDAVIDGDRLYGRGTTDMKAGIAAIIVAIERVLSTPGPVPSVEIVLTAGEETGSEGARFLSASDALAPTVGGIIVAEPTANVPVIAHKGALWLRLIAIGLTAHGSMPHLGKNAIYDLARAVLRLAELELPFASHPIVGAATLNVGTIGGGLNVNSVPDRAEASVDIRTVPGDSNAAVLAVIESVLGGLVDVEVLVDLPPVDTPIGDPLVTEVTSILHRHTGGPVEPSSATYFTDASVLQTRYGRPATIILGPGDPTLAHATDEYCSIRAIDQAVDVYADLLTYWARTNGRD